MASSQEMDLILLVGKTVTIDKRFLVGINALWLYDYLLTFSDEVQYAWSGRTSLIFVLFILNRYWPLWYILWIFAADWSPSYTKSVCDKTAWLSVFYFVFTTLFAQIAITLRVSAVTGNNRRVCAYLWFLTSVQFTFGVYLSIYLALRPATAIPDVPLEEYQFCLFQRWRNGEIIFTALSLVYDASAFLIIVYSARHRRMMSFPGIPNLLDNIVQGASSYFLVIFTGHVLLILFELFAPEPIQLLPASGNAVLVPLAVTRLVLSLKKAANSPGSLWSLSGTGQIESARFARRTVEGTERGGNIVLGYLSSEGSSSFRSDDQS